MFLHLKVNALFINYKSNKQKGKTNNKTPSTIKLIFLLSSTHYSLDYLLYIYISMFILYMPYIKQTTFFFSLLTYIYIFICFTLFLNLEEKNSQIIWMYANALNLCKVYLKLFQNLRSETHK